MKIYYKYLIISLLVFSFLFSIIFPQEVEAAEKYKVAKQVWEYLDKEGYNDYVKAGIIGNMMTECGGQTLKLDYKAKNSSHYGLCQWSKKYCKTMYGASLNEQLKYLNKTMKTEFKSYGKRYKKGFTYNQFLSLQDEKAAARAFALCYERPGSKKTTKREKNAEKAYKYFTKK